MSKEKQGKDSDDIIEILTAYADEYSNDSRIDEFRLKEMELKIPGLKGKWASYKAVNKAQLYKLKKERDRLIEEGVPKIKERNEAQGNPVISNKHAENILKQSKMFKELEESINRLTVLCEYFEDALKNMQQIGFDVKNLVDTIKIDEMQ